MSMRRPARLVSALLARMFPNMAVTLVCNRRTGVSDPAVADYVARNQTPPTLNIYSRVVIDQG
jgi:hypothetical protein